MKPADAEFEAIFDDLFARAMRLAHRITGNAAEAEDVAAETLARTYARWPKVSQLGYRDAWVLRVASNLATDVVRRRRRRVPRVAAAIEGHADASTDHVALRSALHALSRRQRETVVLRYFGGLEEAEVAAVLRISVGSVKQHAHRALSRLRSELGYDDLEESLGTRP